MRDISEIWIIDSSGITLFNLSKEENVQATLIGGFFSALQSFVKELGEKELKSIMLGSSKFMIYQGIGGYLFISRSQNDVKSKKIEEHLKLVEAKFLEMYHDKLDNWNGNTDYFRNFGDIIEEIFKDTPERRAEKALW